MPRQLHKIKEVKKLEFEKYTPHDKCLQILLNEINQLREANAVVESALNDLFSEIREINSKLNRIPYGR